MRRIILQNYVTLDGFAADSKGVFDFAPRDPNVDEDLLKIAPSIDTILLGRKTYALFAEFWPQTDAATEPVADVVNGTPKIVFSQTLERAPWGEAEATVVRGSATEEIERLKAQPGRDMILWGSLSLGHTLIEAGLIDEYQLRVCPITLGLGMPLWPERRLPFGLKFIESKAYPSGTVLLRYHPEGSA